MSRAGWPRPWVTWTPVAHGEYPHVDPRRLPLPFVSDTGDDMLTFSDDTELCHTERLCAVCGESLAETIVLGVVRVASERVTNGPGCHPRCFALTLKYCPHFEQYEDDQQVAFVYRGPGRGYVPLDGDEPPFTESMGVDETSVPITRAELRELIRTEVPEAVRA